MKRKLLWILLALSLAFNLFYLVGRVRTKAVIAKLKTPNGRMELLAKKLKLTGKQSQGCSRILSEQKAGQKALFQEKGKENEGFWSKAMRFGPNSSQTAALLEKAAEYWKSETKIKIASLNKLFAVLDKKQWHEFIKLVLRYKSWHN